ncbi:DNA methyltransferase [Spirochaetia bacterium]|nr:DNA methyltransferase [Spirochaetia bacterium]
MVKRSILRYHGGKWRIAPWILSYIPPHKVYVELFGGGGSVLLRKPRSYSELYNDLDGEIVNLFRVARDRGDELVEKLMLTPYSREEFIKSYESTPDPIEQARRTVARAYMGFGSAAATQGKSSKGGNPLTGFRSNTNKAGTTTAHDWANYPEALKGIIERLRGVVIENRNAIEIIPMHDTESTVFYADPPYLPSVRDYGTDYRFEMTEEDHIQLAEKLNQTRGAVLVSGYHSDLYDELYKGWTRREKNTFADGALPRIEVLWMKGVDQGLFGCDYE